MDQSTYQQLREMEFTLRSMWNDIDLQDLEAPARRSVEAFRRQVQWAQAVARDYEMAGVEEDNRAQQRFAPKLLKALQQLRSVILKASEYDLVGAVDVAQLSAVLDELESKLPKPSSR